MPEPITPPAPLALKDLITEAGLADRGWAKDFSEKALDKDTGLALLKKLDGAESLIGKKTLLPGPDDKPEAWDPVLEKLRPAKADDYEIKTGEGADVELLKAFRESAHHGGIGKVQLSRMLEKFMPVMTARQTAAKAEAEKREQAYQGFLKEMTGKPEFVKEQTRVMNAARELVPEQARQFIDKLDDKSLALFVTFAHSVLSKYAKEDEFGGKEGNPAGNGGDKESLQQELYKILGSPEWANFQDPKHNDAKKRYEEITQALAKL